MKYIANRTEVRVTCNDYSKVAIIQSAELMKQPNVNRESYVDIIQMVKSFLGLDLESQGRSWRKIEMSESNKRNNIT